MQHAMDFRATSGSKGTMTDIIMDRIHGRVRSWSHRGAVAAKAAVAKVRYFSAYFPPSRRHSLLR